MSLSIEERLNLVLEVGEEVVDKNELKELLEKNENLIAYDGFEPSGQMHIAQGILRTINVNKMTKSGFKFKMLVADWFAYLNNKMGGDIEKIQTTGKYFIEIWKAAGMDLDNVEFVWTSDMIKDEKYWELVMKIARTTTLNRVLRTTQIMGRKENDVLQASQIFYPCMQTADIFLLGARVTQLGMDQRKVNMLAREVGEQLGFWKPIIVSHHMMMGLGKPLDENMEAVDRAIEMKMSKSNPDSAIFMTDTEEDVKRKINNAYCPEGDIKDNPILEYCNYLIFEKFDSLLIERPEKFGGNVEFANYTELETAFSNNEIHPMDLKNAVAKAINKAIEPVRTHFETDPTAKELLEKVQSYRVTR